MNQNDDDDDDCDILMFGVSSVMAELPTGPPAIEPCSVEQ